MAESLRPPPTDVDWLELMDEIGPRPWMQRVLYGLLAIAFVGGCAAAYVTWLTR
jgi:hypothetical protein